jgi:hypothetical protein
MNTILENVLKAETAIDQMGSDRTNALDDLAVYLAKAVQSRGVTVHTVWNDLFAGAGWAYKEYDATEDKMITVEGDKAPKRIQTYKSQSKKAFKTLDINTLTTWSQIKDEIKAVPTEEQERISAVIKALKEQFKSGNIELLEYMEKTLNA